MRVKQVAVVAGLILLIPLVLTLLNPNSHFRGGQGGGWDWNPIGIIPIYMVLFVVGLVIDLAWRKIKSPVYRVLAISAIVLAFLLAWVQVVTDQVSETVRILILQPSATDYKNTTFLIEGHTVRLINGTAAGGEVMTRYFGDDLKTDLNGDTIPDLAFLLTQERGGSGTFFYVVGAVQQADGTYIGSDGYFLGDRIAPQNIVDSQNPRQKNVIVVNYADRANGEPMTAQPSLGKSVYLKLDSDMRWGIVVPDFEGESR